MRGASSECFVISEVKRKRRSSLAATRPLQWWRLTVSEASFGGINSHIPFWCSHSGSAFLAMYSSTGIPSINGGRRTRFCLPLTNTVMNAALRSFRRRFSTRVSGRMLKTGYRTTRDKTRDGPQSVGQVSAVWKLRLGHTFSHRTVSASTP